MEILVIIIIGLVFLIVIGVSVYLFLKSKNSNTNNITKQPTLPKHQYIISRSGSYLILEDGKNIDITTNINEATRVSTQASTKRGEPSFYYILTEDGKNYISIESPSAKVFGIKITYRDNGSRLVMHSDADLTSLTPMDFSFYFDINSLDFEESSSDIYNEEVWKLVRA